MSISCRLSMSQTASLADAPERIAQLTPTARSSTSYSSLDAAVLTRLLPILLVLHDRSLVPKDSHPRLCEALQLTSSNLVEYPLPRCRHKDTVHITMAFSFQML